MIKVTSEINLNGFEAWSGGRDTLNELTSKETDILDDYIDTAFPEGIDETELNDFLWFERDYIAEILGYEDFDEIINRNEDI